MIEYLIQIFIFQNEVQLLTGKRSDITSPSIDIKSNDSQPMKYSHYGDWLRLVELDKIQKW